MRALESNNDNFNKYLEQMRLAILSLIRKVYNIVHSDAMKFLIKKSIESVEKNLQKRQLLLITMTMILKVMMILQLLEIMVTLVEVMMNMMMIQ